MMVTTQGQSIINSLSSYSHSNNSDFRSDSWEWLEEQCVLCLRMILLNFVLNVLVICRFEQLDFSFSHLDSYLQYGTLHLHPNHYQIPPWEFSWDKRLSSKRLESWGSREGVFPVVLLQGICLLALGFAEMCTLSLGDLERLFKV